MQPPSFRRPAASAAAAAGLLVVLLVALGSAVGAQDGDDELSLNRLQLRATFEPELPDDAVEVELLGRTVTLGPRESLGMNRLPIGTTTVTVTDVEPDLLELTDVRCQHRDGDPLVFEAAIDAGTFRLSLDADDIVDCELVFEAPTADVAGEASVTALVDDGEDEGTNPYELDMAGTITPVSSQEAATDDTAPTSGYRVALRPHEGPALTDIDCRLADDDERVPADPDIEDRSITFALGIGADVRCTFILGDRGSSSGSAAPDDGIVPRQGRWNIVNLPGIIACEGQTFRVPRTRDRGRVQVRRGGDRIIASGIGGGRGRTVMDRVSDDPSVYEGTVQLRQQGVDFALDVRMDVPDPQRITGTMSGTFSSGGVRCRMDRDFSARFARP